MRGPKVVENYLGCEHIIKEDQKDGKTNRCIEYNMRPFLEQCVDSYRALVGERARLTKETAPFIDEDCHENPTRMFASGGAGLTCPWCKGTFPEDQFTPCPHGQAIKKGLKGWGSLTDEAKKE